MKCHLIFTVDVKNSLYTQLLDKGWRGVAGCDGFLEEQKLMMYLSVGGRSQKTACKALQDLAQATDVTAEK